MKLNLAAKRVEATLPNHFAALRMTCGCFGVGMPEMERALQLVRERDCSPEAFPKKLNRVMLNQAEAGRGPWREVLTIVAKRALYDRVCFHKDQPLWGFTGQFTWELVAELLKLYEQLQPKLRTDGIAPQVALWVLVEELFVPTLFVKLARNWRQGSGDEFQGASCWYLASMDKGDRRYPVARVFQYWLQAIGFRNPHDLGKVMGDSARRKAERWLKGLVVPKVGELHALVGKFGKEVGWTGEPDIWKARFTMACAAHALCEAMDSYFRMLHRESSLELGKMIAKLTEEHIPMDDGRALADSWTFFAARLFHRRLKAENRWEAEVEAKVPSKSSWSAPPEMSNEEVERNLREFRWGLNNGNWFSEAIMREVNGDAPKGAEQTVAGGATLRARILDWGAEELNRILEEKGRRA